MEPRIVSPELLFIGQGKRRQFQTYKDSESLPLIDSPLKNHSMLKSKKKKKNRKKKGVMRSNNEQINQ